MVDVIMIIHPDKGFLRFYEVRGLHSNKFVTPIYGKAQAQHCFAHLVDISCSQFPAHLAKLSTWNLVFRYSMNFFNLDFGWQAVTVPAWGNITLYPRIRLYRATKSI